MSRIPRRDEADPGRAPAGWYRPCLETLEERLPPGETVPSMLAATALLAPAWPGFQAKLSFLSAGTEANGPRTPVVSAAADTPIEVPKQARVRLIQDDRGPEPVTAIASLSLGCVDPEAVRLRTTEVAPMPSAAERPGAAIMLDTTRLRGWAGKDSAFPGPVVADETFGTLAATISPTTVHFTADAGRVQIAYGQLPLSFEANVGQTDSRADFVARGTGYTAFLTAGEAVLNISPPMTRVAGPDQKLVPTGPGAVVHIQLLRGDPAAPGRGMQPLEGTVNYFLGNDPSQWHRHVTTFGQVEYSGVYPGIDLVYHGTNRQLEYDFRVAPGADPGQIRLGISGADNVQVDEHGGLVVQAGDLVIRQPRPLVYQEIDGVRHDVEGDFVLSSAVSSPPSASGGYQVGFAIGAYDASRPLVIDPVVLDYSTYLGGPNTDYAYGVAVDQAGSAYVAGQTYGGFPVVNSLQPYGGGGDAFVAKLSPDGSSLVYASYLGGKYFDAAYGIAVDSEGAAYVTGVTESEDFPVTPAAFQTVIGSGHCKGDSACADAFVTKLSPDGSALVYSTFLGGLEAESGNGIAVDSGGNAYVMGQTDSANFPTLNAVQPTWGGGGCNYGQVYYPCFDAFVTKLSPDGSSLVYSTYLGGNRDEAYFFGEAGHIAIDPAGDAYVTGYTESLNFPTANALQPEKAGAVDAYVTKLSPDGSSFVYSTFLGGSIGQTGYGVAADSVGNAYVTGLTGSADFPTTPDAFQQTKKGSESTFVSKLAPDGSAFVYSTFLGGSLDSSGYAIAADQAGNAYVTGWTYGTDFPTLHAFQPQLGGMVDGFVTKLVPTGQSLIYSSYLGGSADDGGRGIGLDRLGGAYVAGVSNSTDFPTVRPLQAQNGGSYDAFVTKMSRYPGDLVTA
jgi:hypothetical protein